MIGSGPASYHTAQALDGQSGDDVRIDVLDRLPVSFGPIRPGVASDRRLIKAVSRRQEPAATGGTVRLPATWRWDVTIPELLDLHDAVVIATDAPTDACRTCPAATCPA